MRGALTGALLLVTLAVGCEAPSSSTHEDTLAPDTGRVEDTASVDTAAPPDTDVDTVVDVADTLDGHGADTLADTSDTHPGDDTMAAPDTALPPCGVPVDAGAVAGWVCRWDHPGVLEGRARVSVEAVDCHGHPMTLERAVKTDGHYRLDDVPPGTWRVRVDYGDSTGEDAWETEVVAGKVSNPDPWARHGCLRPQRADIAVLSGQFDHVDHLLDGLGIRYELYAGDTVSPLRSGLDLIGDLEALLGYDVLIINSGDWSGVFADGVDTPELRLMREHLHTFVQNGGVLLTTDWAGHWLEALYPEVITFYGDPATATQAGEYARSHIGAVTHDATAQIVDDHLASALDGAWNLHVNFNRSGWRVATGVSPGTEVYAVASQVPMYAHGTSGQLHHVPLIVRHQPTSTSGDVVFVASTLSVQPTSQTEALLVYLLFRL